MLQQLRDLSIRLKIAGFVIPSTIAFGVVMTMLALYFLNDYKETSLMDYRRVIVEMQGEDSGKASAGKADLLLEEISVRADEKIRTIGMIFISIVVAVIFLAAIGAVLIANLIGKPVQRVAMGLENISSGDADLTQRLPVRADDETGKVSGFFNAFLEKLQGIIKNIQSSAGSLADAAQSIYSLIETIKEKASSAKEISQTVFRSAGYMRDDMKENPRSSRSPPATFRLFPPRWNSSPAPSPKFQKPRQKLISIQRTPGKKWSCWKRMSRNLVRLERISARLPKQ